MPAGDAWTWDGAAVGAHVAARLGVVVAGTPRRLDGGLLNVVWRVPLAGGESVVVKVAPPFVASAPDIPLPTSRLRAEARALSSPLLAPLAVPPRAGGQMRRRASRRRADDGSGGTVRTPRLLDFDADASVLVMSDAGDVPHLGTWLASASFEAAADALARLGAFVGRLHGTTLGARDLVEWHQPEIAHVRLGVQYRPVAARLAGVPDAAALGATAVALGERLRAPGRCVVMGDLWPPSVLVGPDGVLTVIDWELSTAGEPAQDVGHLAAHLWLLGRMDLWMPFVAGWRRGAGGSVSALLAGGTADDAARHAACELLARVTGPFGTEREDAALLVTTAADWLRSPRASPVATGLSA